MKKSRLPAIRLSARPAGLSFKTPASAIAKWDRTIKAKAPTPAECCIDIMGEIGDSGWGAECTTATMVKSQLAAMPNAAVRVTLNSPGGDAFEGIAIYNLLRDHPGAVTMSVIGLAASAASVIAMAGDRVEMGEGAMMMIHSAWGVVAGNRNDMRDFADVLDALDKSVAGLYANRSGLSVDDVNAMMEKETWMSAKDAVDNGFADVALVDSRGRAKSLAAPVFAAARPGRSAASGARSAGVALMLTPPGVSGSSNSTLPKGNSMQTAAERIAAFEAKRQANMARMSAIMEKAGNEGRTLDEAETQEYDTLDAEVRQLDGHLVRMKAHEARLVSGAAQVNSAVINLAAAADATVAAAAATAGQGNSGIISVRANVEKGIPFTRYVKALAMSKGNLTGALAIAQNNKDWMATTPQVATVLMAAVAGGDTTSAGWASELVYNQNLVSDFIEMLCPQTIMGKMTQVTKVPFNVRMSGQDSGSSANWVGQGKPVPVSKLHTLEVTLGIAKAAGLVVLTNELVRSSAPSAEMLVRNDLMKTIAQFLDVQFIAPDYAAVANVSPASITNGVTPTPATGTTAATLRTDVQTLFGTWIAANLDPQGGVWIMTPTQALAISLMLNSLGNVLYPDITIEGGKFFGLPVIVSNSAVQVGSPVTGEGRLIVLANQPEILVADDGQVTIDASAEASLEMLDNPTNDAAAGTPTTMVSMFQTNSVALRAVRFINWKKRRSAAVAYIKDAAYVS